MWGLAFGFTLGLVVTYGLAGSRVVSARLSDLETTLPTSFDSQRPDGSQMPSSSGMRLASLEMPVSSFDAEDIDPSALARPPGAFGDRLLAVERPDSFDQRFEGLVALSDTGPAMTSSLSGKRRRTPRASHRARERRANLQLAGLRRSLPLHQRSSAPRKNGFERQIFRRIRFRPRTATPRSMILPRTRCTCPMGVGWRLIPASAT